MAYQRSDRNALLILSAILILSIIANIIVGLSDYSTPQDFSEIIALIDDWESPDAENDKKEVAYFYAFDPNTVSLHELDSLSIPYFIKKNIVSYCKAGGRIESVEDMRKIYGMNDSIFNLIQSYVVLSKNMEAKVKTIRHAKKEVEKLNSIGVFDPNLASAKELESYGFNNFQIKNIVKYRESGGQFNSKQDLKRIYGLDSVFYNTIEKYVELEATKKVTADKAQEFAVVELNSADSSELMALPGIGEVYAQRIIKYRELLGGYYSKEQLLEVYNFKEETYSEISEMITVDTLLLKKLRINFLDFKDLVKHPYLEKSQVNAILKQRNQLGPYNSISELKNNKAFDQEGIARISPYLTCR